MTVGPIAGVLFISTEKVTFCSERMIKRSSSDGGSVRVLYKVMENSFDGFNIKEHNHIMKQQISNDSYAHESGCDPPGKNRDGQ